MAEREARTLEQNTLQSRREAPRSPYEAKAGAVIPAVMIGGVNSDLPGQLLAQVSQNVYDTATGRFILIPQGSKLVGVDHSNITTGQERVLVVGAASSIPTRLRSTSAAWRARTKAAMPASTIRSTPISGKSGATPFCCPLSHPAFSSVRATATAKPVASTRSRPSPHPWASKWGNSAWRWRDAISRSSQPSKSAPDTASSSKSQRT